MKKLLFSLLLLTSCVSQPNKTTPSSGTFLVKYHNPLSVGQLTTVLNQMINKFGSCKPSSISAAPNSVTVRVSFGSPCMTPEELKSVAERTLTDNPVDTVFLSNL